MGSTCSTFMKTSLSNSEYSKKYLPMGNQINSQSLVFEFSRQPSVAIQEEKFKAIIAQIIYPPNKQNLLTPLLSSKSQELEDLEFKNLQNEIEIFQLNQQSELNSDRKQCQEKQVQTIKIKDETNQLNLTKVKVEIKDIPQTSQKKEKLQRSISGGTLAENNFILKCQSKIACLEKEGDQSSSKSLKSILKNKKVNKQNPKSRFSKRDLDEENVSISQKKKKVCFDSKCFQKTKNKGLFL